MKAGTNQWNFIRTPRSKFTAAFWDLIIEGVIRPGSGEDEFELPAIHVTEQGAEALKGAVTT